MLINDEDTKSKEDTKRSYSPSPPPLTGQWLSPHSWQCQHTLILPVPSQWQPMHPSYWPLSGMWVDKPCCLIWQGASLYRAVNPKLPWHHHEQDIWLMSASSAYGSMLTTTHTPSRQESPHPCEPGSAVTKFASTGMRAGAPSQDASFVMRASCAMTPTSPVSATITAQKVVTSPSPSQEEWAATPSSYI